MHSGRVLRVLPYILGFDKALDYVLPEALARSPAGREVELGSVVQVPVRGRPVHGWVVEIDPEPEPDIVLQPVTKLMGIGPSSEVLDLADWACWRWRGRRARFYNLASPPRQVQRQVVPQEHSLARSQSHTSSFASTLFRLAPSSRIWPVVASALKEGSALILFPEEVRASKLARYARRQGFQCVLWPEQWEKAAQGGCSVVGTRSAVFATMPEVSSILIVDEHSEAYHETWQSVTWHAREVARERARRLDVPLRMTSPVPTLEALKDAEVVTQSRKSEREGWAELVIADLRERDHPGLFSHQLTEQLQGASRAVCIVKRTGVSEARQQLARLLREPVGKITARETEAETARVLIGTTVALRRVDRCDLVAFLEFDMLLASPHYRAEEVALALLAEASRLVGAKSGSGRLLVQTRQPDHPVLRSVAEANPEIFSKHDSQLRQDLLLPPFAAVAKITGEEAEEFVKVLRSELRSSDAGDVLGDIDVMGPDQEGTWLLRSGNHETLCNFLLTISEVPESVRISIDPPSL